MVVEKIDLFFVEKLNKREYEFEPVGWVLQNGFFLESIGCIFIYNPNPNSVKNS